MSVFLKIQIMNEWNQYVKKIEDFDWLNKETNFKIYISIKNIDFM